MTYLLEAQEWDALECWLSVVWMLWPPEAGETEDLERVMGLLFRQRPAAVQEPTESMERWSMGGDRGGVLGMFQRTRKRAHKAAQKGLP